MYVEFRKMVTITLLLKEKGFHNNPIVKKRDTDV